jgi:hypothetical protein
MNTRDKILKEIEFFGGKDFDKKKELDLTDEGELIATLKKAKLEGYDLAQKEELEYWEKVRNRKGHTDDNSNGIKNRVEALKKQIEKGDKKE